MQELSTKNVSIGVVGVDREFQIIENDALEAHFDLAMAEVRVLVLLGLRECRCALCRRDVRRVVSGAWDSRSLVRIPTTGRKQRGGGSRGSDNDRCHHCRRVSGADLIGTMRV